MSNYSFSAVIFDLDGVITQTERLHSQAWKQTFDEYLLERSHKHGEPFKPFEHTTDYLPFVDGKPRYKGVESFLQSRNINIPFGTPDDAPTVETICGIGNKKNCLVNELIDKNGVDIYKSTVDFIKALKEAGIRIGVASSSKNCQPVLRKANLEHYFETRVDGVVSAELNLKGKPNPDIFTTACDNLNVPYHKTVIVEDAVSGVQAGANGNFGLVLGIARKGNLMDLKINGADHVVNDMAEIDLDHVEQWFSSGLHQSNWTLEYFDYVPEKERTREALCTVGNGYLGTRGALEETTANEINYPGTYIAGVYNRLASEVGNRMIMNEDLVNCPNWLPVNFRIGKDNWLDINKAEIIRFHRKLNLKEGVLHREMVVRDGNDRRTLIVSRRFVSMAEPHLAAIQYSLMPLNYSERITIRTSLNGALINSGVERYRQLNSKHLNPVSAQGDGASSSIQVKTNQSNIEIAEAAKLNIFLGEQKIKPQIVNEAQMGVAHSLFFIDLPIEKTLTIEKLVSIYTSQDQNTPNPLQSAQKLLDSVQSFEMAFQAHKQSWKKIWDKIDIKIEGDRLGQKLLHLHQFHLLSTVSPHHVNIDAGIPARGLHGEAYRGHIFWDELFILPFYNLHFQETARSVLMYRYRRLNKAREYAREHGYKGAMFPWQSGSNGQEETQVVHLNPLSGKWGKDFSSLQRHISLAIAYNIWQYYSMTHDLEFMEKYGAEILLDISYFWSSAAKLNPKTGRYEISGVMGPDEFHEKYPDSEEGGIKDNTYTNLMVVWLFNRALNTLDRISETAKNTVMKKLELTGAEIKRWQDICEKMNIVISETGILAQFDGYFKLAELDWDAYRKKYGNIHRMDRILKSEGKSPDQYKLAKQADTLMTFYNLSAIEVENLLNKLGYNMPSNYLQKNLEYYIQRTSHGSTLSRVVHAYLANLINDKKISWELFRQALTSDFQDIQGGTTGEGIHAGVMAGTILLALNCFAGVDWRVDRLKVNPVLPKIWRQMNFNFTFRNNEYAFELTPKKVKVKFNSEQAENVTIEIKNETYQLTKGEWLEVEI